jgi:Mn2+/Fe2+ NRAMP family transporter
MKKFAHVFLGIVTSIGGFIEVGSLSTSAQAGASFRFGLLWAVVVATICLTFLIEMSGRLAAAGKRSLVGAVRERFGITFQSVPLGGEIMLDVMVLAAELGGMAIAVQLLTGWSYRWVAIPAALAVWLLLWFGTFGSIENGVAIVGLLTLCFLVAAIRVHPPLNELARGLVPQLPSGHRANYAFLAVSILGATISPYMLNFYASGAVEEKWTEKDLLSNRLVAGIGMGFGSLVAMGVLITSAMVLAPRGIRVDQYEQAALMLTTPFGMWGIRLFAASLFIGCFGAALEVALNLGYAMSQAFGWEWGEDHRPGDDARFSMVYTAALFIAPLLMVAGIPPLKLTLFAMAITAVILPFVVLPFLVLMNDERYVHKHRNHWFGNAVVLLILVMAFAIAIVAIPLEIVGGS